MPQQSTPATNNLHDVVTVLLVEDDPSSLRFYSDALRMSGFNNIAKVFSSSVDALASFAS